MMTNVTAELWSPLIVVPVLIAIIIIGKWIDWIYYDCYVLRLEQDQEVEEV